MSSRQGLQPHPAAFHSFIIAGWPPLWLFFLDAEWSLLLRAQSSLASLNPVVALCNLVSCMRHLFREEMDTTRKEVLRSTVLHAAGKRYVTRVQDFPLLPEFLFCESSAFLADH